jgi:hypothetical protein
MHSRQEDNFRVLYETSRYLIEIKTSERDLIMDVVSWWTFWKKHGEYTILNVHGGERISSDSQVSHEIMLNRIV